MMEALLLVSSTVGIVILSGSRVTNVESKTASIDNVIIMQTDFNSTGFCCSVINLVEM